MAPSAHKLCNLLSMVMWGDARGIIGESSILQYQPGSMFLTGKQILNLWILYVSLIGSFIDTHLRLEYLETLASFQIG